MDGIGCWGYSDVGKCVNISHSKYINWRRGLSLWGSTGSRLWNLGKLVTEVQAGTYLCKINIFFGIGFSASSIT